MKITDNRWVLLVAHVIVNFVLGGVYAFSFFKTSMMQEFGWDSSLLSLAFSINMGIIPIPMLLGGKLIDHGRGKTAIMVGGVLFSLGFILSGFVSTLPLLYLTYGLIAGFGSGMCFTGTLNNLIKFFPDKRGLASGCVLAGVGIGTLLCTQMAKYFISFTSMANTLLYLGLIYLAVFFVVSFFIKSAPSKETGGIAASPMDKDYRLMLKDSRFYYLVIILAIGVFIGMVISSSSAQIGMEMYLLASGALVVSLVSIFNSIGRLIWGAVSDYLGGYNTLVLVYLMMALLMALLIVGKGNTLLFYVGALGIGFTYAGVLTIFPSITSRNFGLRNQGLNYGFMYFGFSVGAIIAPYITSVIAVNYGNYIPVFIIAFTLALIGIGLIFRIKQLTAVVVQKRGGN